MDEENKLPDQIIQEWRERAIETIEKMYPADSNYLDVAQIGKKLLTQAEQEVNDWRDKSTSVLIRYAKLCENFYSNLKKL